MLILTRKVEETIIIGGHTRLKVLQIGDNLVRIGIEAPPDVSIWRGELVREQQRQKRRRIKRGEND